MKAALKTAYILALIVFSVWLFFDEEAAQPGNRIAVHEENASCGDCHEPWRGVHNDACLGCHAFGDASMLRAELRFHEAESHCLECHTEHRGAFGRVSKMDHALLNPELLCATCHFDPHEKLFGENCRECHGLSGWDVAGYRHPAGSNQNCSRCHRPPLSHQDQNFWRRLKVRHQLNTGQDSDVKQQECWRCHVIHDWQHLRM